MIVQEKRIDRPSLEVVVRKKNRRTSNNTRKMERELKAKEEHKTNWGSGNHRRPISLNSICILLTSHGAAMQQKSLFFFLVKF